MRNTRYMTSPSNFKENNANQNLEEDSRNLEFLATISHEIRNPLNAIIGLTHLLQKEESKEEQAELLASLLQSSENLVELTSNILDFSKLESGELRYHNTPVDLKKMIPRALFGQQAIAERKGVEFCLEIDDAVPEGLLMDRVKLTQVLINLISNAIKFTEKGSVKVHINVEKFFDLKVRLIFSVRDTGIGIPEKKQEIIFKPFRQASRGVSLKYGGTGLGLSISKSLVRVMGGELKVESSVHHGSKFSFSLDLELTDGAEKVQLTSAVTPEKFPKGLKILVVDDNKINLLVVCKLLKKSGIAYDTAENGADALARVQKEEFDLILMDLQMPEMDGFAATRAIRILKGNYTELPIIAVSGSTEKIYEEDIVSSGFTDFINKPFRPEDLMQKIFSVVFKPWSSASTA